MNEGTQGGNHGPVETVLICFFALAALGVGAVVVLDRRIARLGERLARLDDIEGLSERVRGLSTELHRKELNEALASRLTELGEAQRRVTAALVELQGQVGDLQRSTERRAREAALPPADELSSRVRQHLADRGYAQVKVLSELGELRGRSGRVVFEARRDGVLHKGHLSLADGDIVDEQVRSAYQAFP